MIRFIDLRGRLTGNRFAFYDTVVDQFVGLDQGEAWRTFDEFADEWRCGRARMLEGRCNARSRRWHTMHLERFRQLCPDWAFHDPDPEP